MGGGNLGGEPKDLWPTTFDFETFLEQDIQLAASASPAPACTSTSEVEAMTLRLLEWVFMDFCTLLWVLRDLEHVVKDFLLMAAPRVVGLVLLVEASTLFWLDFLGVRVVIPFPAW